MAKISARGLSELARFRRLKNLGDSCIEQILVVRTDGTSLLKSRMMPDAHWSEPSRWSGYKLQTGRLPIYTAELDTHLTAKGWHMEGT